MALLAGAKKPLILLGKGAAYAQADDSIKQFIEKTGIPFLPKSMAKGLLPDDHPQCAAAARSLVMENADVVMLMGARLNWLLAHGKGKHWNPDNHFIQLDIDAQEFDSNRPIEAPVAGDIKSSINALLDGLSKDTIKTDPAWMAEIDKDKAANVQKMEVKLNNVTQPMNFFCALKAVRDVMVNHKDIYVVNEGANTLDDSRNIINMYQPRKRLDCGTWGVMGIGMGFAIGAAITSGKSVVAIEGDSAFGFSGMEIETICRFKLPITIVILNNGGIYNGWHTNLGGGADPSPTTLMANARYDKLIEAFGGISHYATTPDELAQALEAGIQSKQPTLIDCCIDPKDGLESGHISSLNPKSIIKV